MSDTTRNPLRPVRDRIGYSRDYVVRRLDPPVTSKTLARWEQGDTRKIRPYYLVQLAEIYHVPVETLRDNGQA